MNLTKDINNENSIQIKSVLGKSFDENELSSILDLKEEDFENQIKNKFTKEDLKGKKY